MLVSDILAPMLGSVVSALTRTADSFIHSITFSNCPGIMISKALSMERIIVFVVLSLNPPLSMVFWFRYHMLSSP